MKPLTGKSMKGRVAAAVIDRIVHDADVLTLNGASYRLKNLGSETLPSARAENSTT